MKIHCDTDRYIREIIDGEQYAFALKYPVVIDIGANIGAFSMFIYPLADKIYAIEPAKKNVENLQKTVRENKLDKIIVKQMAISNSSMVKNMERVGSAGGGGWRLNENGTIPVDCKTLKDFMDDEGIDYVDLVKMDVEGHEFDIISAPLFPNNRIGMIIGEIHEWFGRKKKEQFGEMIEWLGFNYEELENNLFIAKR